MFSPRKYPYSLHRRDWNFLGDGGFYKAKKCKDTVCMKLNWNFKRVGGLEKNPFHRRGIDIFWNYTISERQNSLWWITFRLVFLLLSFSKSPVQASLSLRFSNEQPWHLGKAQIWAFISNCIQFTATCNKLKLMKYKFWVFQSTSIFLTRTGNHWQVMDAKPH